jgi:hypothetical protein
MLSEPIELAFSLHTKNPLNGRQHWRRVAKRGVKEKTATYWALHKRLHTAPPIALPCVVILTRVSAGVLDDDGLAAALKHVRDAVALWIGVDDGDVGRIRFRYQQAPGKRGLYQVRITILPNARAVETIEAAQ